MYTVDRVPKRFLVPPLLVAALPLIAWAFCQFNPHLPKIFASEILDRIDDFVWIARGRPGLDDKVVGLNKSPLGEYYANIGQFEQSRLMYREAIRMCQAMDSRPSCYTATLMRGMARNCMALGNDWEAERLLKDALTIHSDAGDYVGYDETDYEEMAYDQCALGTLYRNQSKHKKAAEMYRKALESSASIQYASQVEPITLYELATIKTIQAEYEDAQKYYGMARSKSADDYEPSVVMPQIGLARTYILKGKFADAQAVVKNCFTRKAMDYLEGRYCLVGPALINCADLLEHAGKLEQAGLFRSYAKQVEQDWDAPKTIDGWQWQSYGRINP